MNILDSRKIKKKINEIPGGCLFSKSDFIGLEVSETRINTELSRLYRNKKISREAKGIYFTPQMTALGLSKVSPIKLAEKILKERRLEDEKVFGKMRKTTHRLIPSGLTLFNVLGLSTQVPVRQEYYSSFNLTRPTLSVKKEDMRVWGDLSDLELMVFLAIGNRDRISGENDTEVALAIKQLIIKIKISPSKLLGTARMVGGSLGRKVLTFFANDHALL